MTEEAWILARRAKFRAKYRAEIDLHRRTGDLFVLSFPKCGRTWHRAMLGIYLARTLNRPDSDAFSLDQLCAEAALRRVVYTHNGANFLDWLGPDDDCVANSQLWQGRPVILILRDPRDVLVSAYFHARYRMDFFQGSLSEFIRNPHTGIEKVMTAYSRWYRDRHRAVSFDVVTYESMHRDAAAALRMCLARAGLREADPGTVTAAVEFCRFANMQRMEETDFYGSGRLQRFSDDPRAWKVREGQVGRFTEHLSGEDLAYVDEVSRRLGNPFAELVAEAR